MNKFRLYLIVLACALFATVGWQNGASAQTNPSAKEQEDAYIRGELQRIIKEDPAAAPEAQKAIDALNQPGTSSEGRQARNRRERGARRVVNGFPSTSHPAVGALLKGNNPRSASAWCTGTLVGCDKVLTAAHCIAQDPAPGSYLVFFQELGFFRVKSIRWEKSKYNFPYFDLAMLTLDAPVVGIAPMPVNRSLSPLNGSPATIVGFGRTGGMHYDYGIKREGSIKTAACPSSMAKDQVLCWHFDADVKSAASAQNTCNADSGGGIFIRDNDGSRVVEKVFGVVSGGADSDCMKNDVAYNADVFQYRDWIEAAGEGRLSAAMCGTSLWDKTHEPARRTFRLEDGNPEANFTIDVPEGTTALRIAMNGENNNSDKNAFGFIVFSGNDAANATDACNGTGTGQFAFCTIDKPRAGVWTVASSRKKGGGEVQVTTVLVGAQSPHQ